MNLIVLSMLSLMVKGKIEAFDNKAGNRVGGATASGHFARPDRWQTTILSTGAEKITYPDCLSTLRLELITRR